MISHEELSDGELVKRYLLGETSLLTVLVKRYHRSFCNKAYWILKDPDIAKDIAQDCWTTIMKKLDSLKDGESFCSWANRIVYTKSLDELRRINRKRIKQDEYKKDIIIE
ncbi:MAG: RNA polymerase sigma factor, partial [Flavobacteriaceae bacterium]